MIRLVRGFKEQRWAKQFLRGDIYMNTLGYFWNEGNVEQQDFLEGACASFDPHIMRGLPEDSLGVLAKQSYAIPRGAGYCIAHLTRRAELAEDLQRVRGCSVPYFTRGCFGTKTSQELSRDLFELGNEGVFIMLTIG